MSDYEDIIYSEEGRTATICINRPHKYNAFRPRTVVELLDAFLKAGWDKNIGSIIFTGTGDKAFCTGGDQSEHEGGMYGDNDARGSVGMPVEELEHIKLMHGQNVFSRYRIPEIGMVEDGLPPGFHGCVHMVLDDVGPVFVIILP